MQPPRPPRRARVALPARFALPALAALGALAAACTAGRPDRAQCAFNDQCAAGLVCAAGVCRAACRTDRDCTAGARCLAAGQPDAGACVPPDAPTPCLTPRDCMPGQICARDGLCRAQCVTARDCAVRAPWLAGAMCENGACTLAPPALRPLAPMPGAVAPAQQALVRFARAADDTLPVVIVLCGDRVCGAPVPYPVTGASTEVALGALSPGVWFWRVGHVANGRLADMSPLWFFTARNVPTALPNRPEAPRFDADNDGLPDVIASAPYAAMMDPKLFAFGVTFDVTHHAAARSLWSAGSGAMPSELGVELESLGDFDNDGRTDLFAVNVMTRALTAYMGSPSGLSSTSQSLGQSGAYASGVGDINRDGASDLVFFNPTTGVGVLYGPNGAAGSSFPGRYTPLGAPTDAELFGQSIAQIADLDADSYADVLLGDVNVTLSPGRVLEYRGGAMGVVEPAAVTLRGDGTLHESFGYHIVVLGDVNGDGYLDAAVESLESAATRQLWLYHGSGSGLQPAGRLMLPGATGTAAQLKALGDANCDGYADLALHQIGADAERVHVFYGSPRGLDPAAFSVIENAPADPLFGSALGAPGDLDGDGCDELMVAAPSSDQLLVYRGGPLGVDPVPAGAITSPVSANRTFGTALVP